MARNAKFNADAAFSESLEKRVSGYERKADKAKKAWLEARRENQKPNSSNYVDIPEFMIDRKYDSDTGKVTYELGQSVNRIETPHLEGVRRLRKRAYYEASGYVHKKISENEQDNIGVEATHKMEQRGEEAVATLKGMLPSGRSLSRKLQQSLEQKAQRERQDNRLSLFQKEMDAYREKQNSNMFLNQKKPETFKQTNITFSAKKAETVSKETTKDAAEEAIKADKRRQKKRMVKKAMRDAQREAAKNSAKTARRGAEAGVASGSATTAAVASTTTSAAASSGAGQYILYAVLIIICIILVLIIIGFCVLLVVSQNNLQNNVMAAMYQSEPQQIEAAELHYSYLEAELQRYLEEVDEIEEGYDGYVIDEAAGIGHNPYTLINYLSAKYGEFTYSDVEDEIDELFNKSYTLTTWVEDIEVSPSEEEDPGGEESGEEEAETVTLHIFHVKLTKKSLEEIVAERMNEEETGLFDTYGETHGGFQFAKSPTGDDFTNRISSNYGYRYHPIHEEIRLHRGLDIALPEGTELYAGITGTVTTAAEDPGGYGKCITITGDDGTQMRYGHMSEFAVSEGQSIRRGDLIGKSGNTGASTGPHVHVEVLQNGEYYNPLFYLETE